MKHIPNHLVLAWAILVLAVPVAGAQTAPTSPSTPGSLGAQSAPPMSASPLQEKLVDGPVKHVDPLAKTISVGWMLGIFSTTLEVTEDTRIAVEGTAGSLQDIREGDVVEAAYEVRDGKNIAKSIEVTEAEPRRAAGAPQPQGSPATPGSPSMGPSQGAGAPSTGAPKAP